MDDAQRRADWALYGASYEEAGAGRRIEPVAVGHYAMPYELRAIGDAFAEDFSRLVTQQARAIGAKDEAMARAAISERFPRTGAWLVEHPRALRLLFRLRPGLRPTMIYQQGTPGAQEVRWP